MKPCVFADERPPAFIDKFKKNTYLDKKLYICGIKKCLPGMDELSLIVEGLENKVKKLLMRNKQLKDRIFQLEQEKQGLLEGAELQTGRIRELEENMAALEASRVLVSGDSMLARQKIDELLREIDKCQSLLNS